MMFSLLRKMNDRLRVQHDDSPAVAAFDPWAEVYAQHERDEQAKLDAAIRRVIHATDDVLQ